MPAIFQLGFGYLLFSKVVKGLLGWKALSEQQTRKRIQLSGEPPYADIFSHLLAANQASNDKSGPLFTHADLVGESSLLIVGGK